MTKQELCTLFPNFSPKGAFKDLGVAGAVDGFEVCGKYVRVAPLDDSPWWDVFICNVRNMTAGLSAMRTTLLTGLAPEGIEVRVVDGEAWWQSKDVNQVREWLERHRARLGIKKRRILSEDAQARASARGKEAQKRLRGLPQG